jgi:rubredoxin
VAEPLPARPSCPECGARASARSKACADCGYAFVEDSPRAGRPRRRSARAAERRLEARFVSPNDDDVGSASCSALQPRPAHAIRWCRIGYAYGGERTVIVLLNPQGHELLVER